MRKIISFFCLVRRKILWALVIVDYRKLVSTSKNVDRVRHNHFWAIIAIHISVRCVQCYLNLLLLILLHNFRRRCIVLVDMVEQQGGSLVFLLQTFWPIAQWCLFRCYNLLPNLADFWLNKILSDVYSVRHLMKPMIIHCLTSNSHLAPESNELAERLFDYSAF